MNSRIIFTFVALLCLASVASSTIRRVSQNGVLDYPTLQAAHDAATSGDTILVNPGRYDGFISTKRLKVVGAGFDQTTFTSYVQFNTNSGGSVLSGVAFGRYSYYQIDIRVDSIAIERCRLDSVDAGYAAVTSTIAGSPGKRIYILDCLFRGLAGYPINT